MTEEEDLEDLRNSTRKAFEKCVDLINYVETHPIIHDSTYAEILKSSRGAFNQASKARLMIRRNPYEANPPITFALDHLKAERALLDRLLAQEAVNPTIAAIQAVGRGVDAARGEIADSAGRTQDAIQRGFEDFEPTKNGVEFLVDKKHTKIIKGREAQKKAVADPYITDPKKRAAADMARAVLRVHDDPGVKAGKHGALKSACVRVCDEFEGLGRKLPNGKFSQYAPLMDWQTKPIKWESLRRAYNKKHGKMRDAESQERREVEAADRHQVEAETRHQIAVIR